MLNWTINFLVLAMIAAFFGFGNVALNAVEFARICFFIFIVLFVISFVRGRNMNPPQPPLIS